MSATRELMLESERWQIQGEASLRALDHRLAEMENNARLEREKAGGA